MKNESNRCVVEPRTERTGGGGCCSPLSHDLTAREVEADASVFSALGNDTRYEVLRFLAAADHEVCACELVPGLDVNQSSTSRALNALRRAGLVARRKDGRWRRYTTTRRAEKLLGVIDDIREARE